MMSDSSSSEWLNFMHRIVKSPNLKTEPKIEGINNKIKTIKRQAYGYRDQEFFELKILSMYDSINRFVE